MKVTTKQLSWALYDAIKESPAAAHEQVIKNFVQLLGELHLMSRAEKIIADFAAYYNRAEGIETVSIETARPLSSTEATEVTQQLAKMLDKKIELVQQLEPSIIGGWRLRYADTLIDGSLRARLQQLRQVAQRHPAT